MAEAVFQHRLEYPDNHGITLSEIAATLVAQEKLIPIAIEILEKIYPGLHVQNVKINFDYARYGSLQENLFVAILIVYQKDLDKAVPELIEKLTGLHVPDDYKTLVSVLTVILLYFGVKTLTEKLTNKKQDKKLEPPTISGDYNTYINLASGTLNVSPEQVDQAVNATVTPKRRGVVARSAIDLFRPAKRGAPGRIVVPGLPEISKETVADFPDAAALADLEDDTEVEPYANATLEIRATDMDKADTGWAGRLSAGGMSTKRLTVKLSPTVDREALAKRRVSKVEALLESRRVDDALKPLRIHVIRVLD